MAVRASRSSLIPLLFCLAAAALCWSKLQVFAFTGSAAPQHRASLRHASRTSSSALPESVDMIMATQDASSIVIADATEAYPFVAFFASTLLGIVGYSIWTAFGPGAADLRDPFEEHED
eukprot:TRINITY_DN4507_c2_g1_i1.p1 TRINITY_DN4507_c2_g1~~TRINITY_DN4507_c2_g1_i1.p1  ORF type:complete len:119 (+),score=24.92 TRINITY_DN4507_c2_g1_i1:71-427(+)